MIERWSEFSMMRIDCLFIDWFSDEDNIDVSNDRERIDEEFSDCSSDCSPDCSPGWPTGCFSSWFCDDERVDMSDDCLLNEFCEVRWDERDDMNDDCLYEELNDNRLYNCLLKNTDGNSDDWKNFENRDEDDCLFKDESDDFSTDFVATDCSRDDHSFDDDYLFACHE
jgi:hypothetical protein